MITKGGTGASVFATLGVTRCVPSEQIPEQMSFVLRNGLGSQANAAAGISLPALQREDASCIGTNGYNTLIGVGLDGSGLWRQQSGLLMLAGAGPRLRNCGAGVERTEC